MSQFYKTSYVCLVLGVSRSMFYYKSRPRKNEQELELLVISEFKESKEIYGERKIKAILHKKYGITVSRKRIRNIEIFHYDRGSEALNKPVDQLMSGFGIDRSYSAVGNPFDNTVI